jgi:hypothetical protein
LNTITPEEFIETPSMSLHACISRSENSGSPVLIALQTEGSEVKGQVVTIIASRNRNPCWALHLVNRKESVNPAPLPKVSGRRSRFLLSNINI